MSYTDTFIQEHKGAAIREMVFRGIPASVTMAQAILESGWGRSPLAVEANNFFGIKASDWKGPTYTMPTQEYGSQGYYVDPDAKFRKYSSDSASFKDHSKFLIENKNYSRAFQKDIDDYAGWAAELKRGGYATAPDYVQKVVSIVNQYKLQELDRKGIQLRIVYKAAKVTAVALGIILIVKLIAS